MTVTEDFNWITKHYSELQRKYSNQYVAIKKGKVIARDLKKVYDKAREKAQKDFVTGYIPSAPFVFDTPIQGLPDMDGLSHCLANA